MYSSSIVSATANSKLTVPWKRCCTALNLDDPLPIMMAVAKASRRSTVVAYCETDGNTMNTLTCCFV